nr:hypothetical protein [Saccharopolyspora hordei]
MLVAVASTALAGCGVQPSGIIHGSSPPSGAVAPAASTTLYFVSGGWLEPVARGPMSPAEALGALAGGPTAEERARGLTSEVPPAAAPFTVTTDVSGRTVVTTSVPGGELSALAVEQIVCTAAADGGPVVLVGARDDSPVGCPPWY